MENSLYPRIALTGSERSGKDEVGRILVARYGYTRYAFGDLIKKRITSAPLWHLSRLTHGLRSSVPPNLERARDVTIGFLNIRTGRIDASTENDADKNIIRSALERYGEVFWPELLTEYYKNLPLVAVNTRLIKPEEAMTWARHGGVTFEVKRPGRVPVTQWGLEQLTELRRSGYIVGIIHNDGSLDDLADEVAAKCRMLEK